MEMIDHAAEFRRLETEAKTCNAQNVSARSISSLHGKTQPATESFSRNATARKRESS